MADLSISETQFVFTYLHHYLNLSRTTSIQFILPTLLEEGDPKSPYAGADLVISGNLYIQFKVPDLLSSSKTKEIETGKLPMSYAPFFRFGIKNTPTLAGIGQYDILVNRTMASSFNIVKYVSVIFDDTQYSRSSSSSRFWYNSFLNMPPIVALPNFTCEVAVNDIISSLATIGANDEHRICYNFDDIISGNPVYIFSEQGNLKMSRGIVEYSFEEQDFRMPNREETTLELELLNLNEITRVNSNKNKPLSFTQMQLLLIREYNIFWIPFIKK